MTFTIPESVRCYYGDPAVQSGIDALLAKPKKLPPDLRWTEMPDYYQAWLAAHRVVVDHAVTLDAAWNLVWRDAVPLEWSPASPDNQIAADGDTDPHPFSSWANDWFVRCFNQGKHTLYTATSIGEAGLSIGFGVYNARGTLAVNMAEGFEPSEISDLLWLTEPVKPNTDGKVDLEVLHKAVLCALASIPQTA